MREHGRLRAGDGREMGGNREKSGWNTEIMQGREAGEE